MDSALRAMLVFVVLWVMIRLSGRRTLGKLTSFEFVLLLIIGGATQRALTGQDYSVVNAFIIVATLITMNVLVSILEEWCPALGKWINGVPTVLVEDGQLLRWRMRRARISEEEIMAAARSTHGLERLDQIKFAVLEASGHISVIPVRPAGGG